MQGGRMLVVVKTLLVVVDSDRGRRESWCGRSRAIRLGGGVGIMFDGGRRYIWIHIEVLV